MIMPSRKGQYIKIWDKVEIEKLQNEHQWSWRVNNKEHVLLYGVISFVLSWSGTWVVHPIPSPDHFHWNQWTLIKTNIPVTINMKIHANQAPAISFVNVFNRWSGRGLICMDLLVKVLWDWMVWVMHTCLFVCCLFACVHVCLNPCMLMFMLECITKLTTKRHCKTHSSTQKKIEWLTKGNFATFQCRPSPHFKARTAPPCKP